MIQICPFLKVFIIQTLESTRGRSNKRPWASSSLSDNFPIDSTTQNGNSSTSKNNHIRKRLRKSTQLSQFKVYQDEILSTDSDSSDAQNEPTPVSIKPQMSKKCPHISVEIPLRSDFRPNSQSNSTKPTSQKGNRQPLASLGSIAINGIRKAPKIPQKWLKNQPNDHTSKFF